MDEKINAVTQMGVVCAALMFTTLCHIGLYALDMYLEGRTYKRKIKQS